MVDAQTIIERAIRENASRQSLPDDFVPQSEQTARIIVSRGRQRSGSSGRSTSSFTPAPPPTFESSLLNQSFSSQEELDRAEAEFIVNRNRSQQSQESQPTEPPQPGFLQQQTTSGIINNVDQRVLSGGSFIPVTQQEFERDEGKIGSEFFFVPPDNVLGSIEAGQIAGDLSTGIAPGNSVLGVIPKEVRESAKARTTDLQEIIDLREEQRSDIDRISKEFQSDPESFRDLPGFSETESDGFKTFSLGSEIFDTLPSTQGLSKFTDDQGFFVPQTLPSDVTVASGGFRENITRGFLGGTKLAIAGSEATLEFPFEATTRAGTKDQLSGSAVNVDLGELPLIGSSISNIKSQPVGVQEIIGGAILASPFAIPAGKRFIQGSFQKGLRTTLKDSFVGLSGSLSPVKIKGGTFFSQPDFRSVSVSQNLGDDLTGRITVGRDFGGAEKVSVDVLRSLESGGVKGARGELTKVPAIRISQSGGAVETGNILLGSRSRFFSTPSGSGRFVKDFGSGKQSFRADFGEPFQGGAGVSTSRLEFAGFIGERNTFNFKLPNVAQIRRFGGVSGGGSGNIDQFISGNVKSFDSFLGRPTKLRVKPSERGININIPDFSGSIGKTFSSRPKRRPSSLQSVLSEQSFTPPPLDIPKPPRVSTPKTSKSGITTIQTQIGGVGLSSPSIQTPRLDQEFKTITRSRTVPSFTDIVNLGQVGTGRLDSVVLSKPSSKQITPSALTEIQLSGVDTAQRQVGLLRQATRTGIEVPKVPRGFGFDFSFRPGRSIRFPIPPFPSLRVNEPFRPRAKGKRRQRRTPSLLGVIGGVEDFGFTLSQERTGLIPRGLRPPRRRKKRR